MPELADGGDDDRVPEWFMPPQMIGGLVAGPQLITGNAAVVLAVRRVVAFPTGVEVEVEAHWRGTGRPLNPAPPADDDTSDTSDDDDGYPQLRFAVRFGDGRQAAQNDEAGLRSGLGPMLTVAESQASSGGPNDREDVRLTLWIWPLPPPGEIVLTCSWPSRGLRRSALTLDGDSVRAAAALARPFWPTTAA